MVTDPTRPQIIKNAKSSLVNILTPGVNPKEQPTVAIADTVSNNAVIIGIPSTAETTTADTVVPKMYIMNTQDAVLVIFSSIRRPNASTFFFLKNTVKMLRHKIQNVVVFIPPAVDPVDPPMYIRQIITNLPGSDMALKSTVLNPAVLAVTD